MSNYSKIHMGEAKCGLDLGDGSERAEYVCQDYILNKLGRPHRCVNIMYTLYPKDKQWPQRISEACKDMEIHFQWDYPYDDYFPFDVNGQPFEQMRDIRRHGQDVLLTLTIDCSLDDDYLREVARKFKTFGRMRLRINHECAGDWFTHNKRFSYKEVGDFFVRFHNIIKQEAPNVSTIFCAGFLRDDGSEIEHEQEFLDAYRAADLWSADCYLALHFGWPYDIAEKDSGRHTHTSVEYCYNRFKNTAQRLTGLCGAKPMTTAEFNTDGDVTGAFRQGESIIRFAEMFRDNNADWFKGISMYQFRDRGRLGLEIEDPNNHSVGIEQPVLEDYKKVLFDPYFMPQMTSGGQTEFPVTFRWGGSEDADGIELNIDFEDTPEFCEITVEDPISLIMELNGRWFYKSPDVRTVDLMPAFFKNRLDGAKTLFLKIFATPKDGENIDDGSEEWDRNYYAQMKHAPELRIRYEAPAEVG